MIAAYPDTFSGRSCGREYSIVPTRRIRALVPMDVPWSSVGQAARLGRCSMSLQFVGLTSISEEVSPVIIDPDEFAYRWEYTLAELDAYEFPDLKWVIPGLIPEGLSILAGPPKAGKSWMALDMALAYGMGRLALGAIETQTPGRVLYLALEDGPRRFQSRSRQILGPASEMMQSHGRHFDVRFHWPRGDEAYTELNRYFDDHPDTGFVVIDVISKIREPGRSSSSEYLADYEHVGRLQSVAIGRAAATLGVHHTRKTEANDWLSLAHGTHGITGAADTVMVLQRQRSSSNAKLGITGRDVAERQLDLRMEPSGAGWTLVGESTEAELTALQQDIVATIEIGEAVAPAQVSERLLQRSIDHRPGTVRTIMVRMAERGDLVKSARGQYLRPPPDGHVLDSESNHL